MSETILAPGESVRATGKAMTVTLWTARIVVGGILGRAAFTKFFVYSPEGSMALAETMGVGRGVITMIGLVELSAASFVIIGRRMTN